MKTALVIVDMLNDFVDGTLANPAAKPIIDPIGALAEEARRRDDWVVIYANDAHRPGDFELAIFGEHAMAGTRGAEVIDDLRPEQPDLVVPKRYYSAFTETDMTTNLAIHQVGQVVLVGQHTDCCIRHTSYDAFQRGLRVVVPADATAVFEPLGEEPVQTRQQRALDYLKTFYGAEVVESRDLL
ncbi:MAG: isochorismatase [Acidimicrobiia bacterium]|nr:MAG: isochorismatase [Acidimicrobiia bacterium]